MEEIEVKIWLSQDTLGGPGSLTSESRRRFPGCFITFSFISLISPPACSGLGCQVRRVCWLSEISSSISSILASMTFLGARLPGQPGLCSLLVVLHSTAPHGTARHTAQHIAHSTQHTVYGTAHGTEHAHSPAHSRGHSTAHSSAAHSSTAHSAQNSTPQRTQRTFRTCGWAPVGAF